MAFTEFACRSGGSNMNGGAIASNGEPATSPVYSATNGGWNSATGVFTPAAGNPSLTVTVGDYASVFLDGATTPVFIARVTAVNSTTITTSTTVKAGTAPTTAGSGVSINVGGAWLGPNGANGFPLSSTIQNLNNLANGTNTPRINMKNDATYSISAAMTCSINAGELVIQGYTSTFGDFGRAILDGGTTGASYTLLTINNAETHVYDMIFQNNGATGSAAGFARNGGGQTGRCVAHDLRGVGLYAPFGGNHFFFECESYNCNQSNTAGFGGFFNDAISIWLRCIAHDNSGSNNNGFVAGGSGSYFINCISDTNGSQGYRFAANSSMFLIGCDAYNNGGDGVQANGNPHSLYVENCNLVKNTGWGINLITSTAKHALLVNNKFGAGTQANGSGTVNGFGSTVEINSSNYASGLTPWVDPANGDFRVNLAAAINSGRGNFTQTAASYAGSISYPDVGAVQHQETGGGGSVPVIGG